MIKIQLLKKYITNFVIIIFTFSSFCHISFANSKLANAEINDNLIAPLMWNLKHFNEHFVGRKEFLKNMHDYFFTQENNLLVVSGEGGSGKADVIQRFVEQHQETYNIVWWFDVKGNLKEQYRNFALEWNRIVYDDPRKNLLQINFEHLNEDELIEQVNDRLRITKLNWLIVLDKVQETADALKYTPKKSDRKSSGHIIISTKNSTIHENVMHLGPLKREESIELLLKLTGSDDRSQANLLAATLDDSPIAVSRAGLFIATYPAINMKEYNRLFKNDRHKLWEAEKQLQSQRVKFNSYKATVYSTKIRNIEEVRKESALAYELLGIISFLDNKHISENLLKEYFKQTHNKENNNIEFTNALSLLMKYSLLNRENSLNHKRTTTRIEENEKAGRTEKDIFYETSELTQLIMQDLLHDKEKKHYLEDLSLIFNQILLDNPHYLNEQIDSPHIISHIKALNKHAYELKLYDNRVFNLYLLELEHNIYNITDNKEIENLINKIEEVSKNLSEPDNTLMLKYALLKSEFLGSKADYTTSIKEALTAYEISKKLENIKPEEKLMTYNRLARLYNVLGNTSEALKYADLSKKVVEQEENYSLNPRLNDYRQDSYRIAAKIYVDYGELDQALKYAVISTKEVALDNDSRMPLSDISANLILIDILIRLERLEEAKQKLESLKKAINHSLPKEHIYQANIMSYSCYVDALLGNIKIDQAIKENFAAQNLHKKLLGESYHKNRHVFMNHRFLGELYEKQGNVLKAEEEYSTGLKILTNIYNNDEAVTDDLSYFHAKLAIVNLKLQQPDTALKHLNTHHKIFGKKHKRSVQLVRYFIANKVNIGM